MGASTSCVIRHCVIRQDSTRDFPKTNGFFKLVCLGEFLHFNTENNKKKEIIQSRDDFEAESMKLEAQKL